MRSGAFRIASSTGLNDLETVAFKNPDGSKVLIVLNTAPTERNFRVLDKNDAFEAVLPGGSVAIYVYRH